MFRARNSYASGCQAVDCRRVLTDDERMFLQRHLLKMYKDVEAVCRRHNLNICLAFGSVLGAVRHGGFIPWDDDIDLYMPRADYDRLLNEFADELPSNYQVVAPNLKNNGYSRFAKIVDLNTRFVELGAENAKHPLGVFLDIFPLENIEPETKIANKLRKYRSFAAMFIANAVSQYRSKSQILKQIMTSSFAGRINYIVRQLIGGIFSFRSYSDWLNTIEHINRYDTFTGFVHCPAAIYSNPWHEVKYEDYFPAKEVSFDDTTALIPNKAKEYLVRSYGNWEKVPPESERWQHFIYDFTLDSTENI